MRDVFSRKSLGQELDMGPSMNEHEDGKFGGRLQFGLGRGGKNRTKACQNIATAWQLPTHPSVSYRIQFPDCWLCSQQPRPLSLMRASPETSNCGWCSAGLRVSAGGSGQPSTKRCACVCVYTHSHLSSPGTC